MPALLPVLAFLLSTQGVRTKLKAVGEQLEQEQIDVARLLSEEGPLLDVIENAAHDEAVADRALRDGQRKSAEVAERLGEARAREAAAQTAAEARLVVVEPRLRVWQRLST